MTRGTTRDKPYGGSHVDSFAARLYVDPSDNIIVGAENICRYMGISSIVTMWRWVELYAFPAIKRPDGVWITSMTAVDQWIFLAAELVNEKTQRSRGLNTTADIALKRIEHQVANPEVFAQKRQNAALRAARGVGLMPGRKERKSPYIRKDGV
jgi:hypothetical protein